jgi:hypothetical protein
VFHPESDIDEEVGGFEDNTVENQVLRYLGVDRVTPDADHGGPTAANGPLCQTVHRTRWEFGANVKRRAKKSQVWEYEERERFKAE